MWAVWNWGLAGEDMGLSSSYLNGIRPFGVAAAEGCVMVLYLDGGFFPSGVAWTRQFLSSTRWRSASSFGLPPGVLRAVDCEG